MVQKKLMKLLSKIIFLLHIYNLCISQKNNIDYQSLIQPSVTMWQNECINKLSSQEIITIADMLLLSYQVVQASVVMSQAKLIIQSELFNIVTLSINDSLDARLQAENNDLTTIKNAIMTIEQAQESMKFACNTLKGFGPLIIQIDPTTIQIFIANVKTVILNWAKTQESIIIDLEKIEKEFLNTPELFSRVKNIFEDVYLSDKNESYQLIDGTNNLNDMYDTIEHIYADLTIIRKDSILNFNNLLTFYFKYHYQLLYNAIKNIDRDSYKIMATTDHKLPEPEKIFFVS